MASITIKYGHIMPPLSPTHPSITMQRSVVVRLLWAAQALLLSSTCLLNDSNYFPQLQATHACFISSSTFPICLYGPTLHQGCPIPVLGSRNPGFLSYQSNKAFTWDSIFLGEKVFCLVGLKTWLAWNP